MEMYTKILEVNLFAFAYRLNIIRNTKYRQTNDKFQNQLEKDKKDITVCRQMQTN